MSTMDNDNNNSDSREMCAILKKSECQPLVTASIQDNKELHDRQADIESQQNDIYKKKLTFKAAIPQVNNIRDMFWCATGAMQTKMQLTQWSEINEQSQIMPCNQFSNYLHE